MVSPRRVCFLTADHGTRHMIVTLAGPYAEIRYRKCSYDEVMLRDGEDGDVVEALSSWLAEGDSATDYRLWRAAHKAARRLVRDDWKLITKIAERLARDGVIKGSDHPLLRGIAKRSEAP